MTAASPHAHPPELILGSASPRRAELLRDHGYRFRVLPSPDPEPACDASSAMQPARVASFLSEFKADRVAQLVTSGLILAADTVTVLSGGIFGKPADRDDARRILRALCGTRHEVITAVTLLDAATHRRLTRADTTVVYMRRLSDADLEAYLDSGAWEAKAGAYGIQDHDDPFVERIEGSFTNVVGLPMELLSRMIEEFTRGLPPPAP